MNCEYSGTLLNGHCPQYIQKSGLFFHSLKQPLNSGHPTIPYNKQFLCCRLYITVLNDPDLLERPVDLFSKIVHHHCWAWIRVKTYLLFISDDWLIFFFSRCRSRPRGEWNAYRQCTESDASCLWSAIRNRGRHYQSATDWEGAVGSAVGETKLRTTPSPNDGHPMIIECFTSDLQCNTVIDFIFN